jgi:hypothetical protein
MNKGPPPVELSSNTAFGPYYCKVYYGTFGTAIELIFG